jgi:hypothetical protein
MKGIVYDGELFDELNSTEYAEWEDAVDAISGKNKEIREATEQWITYDFLMSKGYFVKQPKVPRPTKADEKPRMDTTGIPRTTQKREPEWSQSKILKERERLVRDKEKILKRKERELKQLRQIANRSQARPMQFYKDDGTPYTNGNYLSVMLTVIILFCVVTSCVLSVHC